MCDYQCTSVSFIKLSNRIEKSIRQRESNQIPRIGMLYNSDPKFPVVVVVVLSNVDVGDPRCPIHGEDAIFTHKL